MKNTQVGIKEYKLQLSWAVKIAKILPVLNLILNESKKMMKRLDVDPGNNHFHEAARLSIYHLEHMGTDKEIEYWEEKINKK